MERKTKEQQSFDLAIAGWSFSNARMLEQRILSGTLASWRLSSTDNRHLILEAMKSALSKMEKES